jgi:archaemetzincin
MSANLYLIQFDAAPNKGHAAAISAVMRRLTATFGLEAVLLDGEVDPTPALDHRRKQHNALVLLQLLGELPLPPDARRLGIISHDLFIPMLTHVFGLAQLGGTTAVVSTNRLRERGESDLSPRELFTLRLEKEAVHELGHAYGLVHCTNPDCAMQGVTDVAEIDLRPPWLCHRCHERLSRPEAL